MTTRPARSGFTLVEMTVVVVLTGVLALALHQAYLRQSRFVGWQEHVVLAHDAFRVAGSLLSADLREAVPAQGDLVLLDSDSISVRAPIGLAFVCGTVANPAVAAIHGLMGSLPQATGDSLMVYATSGWRSTAMTGTETPGSRGLSCHGRTPQAQLRLPTAGADNVPAGAPVRVYRRHLYHLVTNNGAPWLARTSSAAGTEPLVGPLAAGGLRFRLLDSGGLDETNPAEVAAVEFRMVLLNRPTPTSVSTSMDTVVSVFQVRNR